MIYLGINDAVILASILEKNNFEDFNRADQLKDEYLNEKIINYVKIIVPYIIYIKFYGYLIAKKYGVTHGTNTWEGSLNKKN